MGRSPKSIEAAKRCALWADSKGFDFLEDVAEGKLSDINDVDVDIKTRVAVAFYLINRGYGTPIQKEDIRHSLDPESQVYPGVPLENLKKARELLQYGNITAGGTKENQ